MKKVILICSLAAMFVATHASAAVIPGRIVLGTNEAAADPFPRFFGASSGFMQGMNSHTNSIAFDDGVGKVEFTITISAFNASGAPAGLFAGSGATGVELGVDGTRIDAGESVVVTYDNIVYSELGGGSIIDPASFKATLNALHFNSFTDGVDTYTYTGLGAGSIVGDDTFEILVGADIVPGDSFTVTGDSGAFRMQWLSQQAEYQLVPEPTSLILAALGLAAIATARRHA